MAAAPRTVACLEQRSDRAFTRPNEVDVGAPGYALDVNWSPVSGATKAVVDQASVTIGPALVEQSFTDLLAGAVKGGTEFEIRPKPGWRPRSATLQSLEIITGPGANDKARLN